MDKGEGDGEDGYGDTHEGEEQARGPIISRESSVPSVSGSTSDPSTCSRLLFYLSYVYFTKNNNNNLRLRLLALDIHHIIPTAVMSVSSAPRMPGFSRLSCSCPSCRVACADSIWNQRSLGPDRCSGPSFSALDAWATQTSLWEMAICGKTNGQTKVMMTPSWWLGWVTLALWRRGTVVLSACLSVYRQYRHLAIGASHLASQPGS